MLAKEGQLDHPGRAVALLGDNDLGLALLLGVARIVDFIAIDEEDHVRILLDRP